MSQTRSEQDQNTSSQQGGMPAQQGQEYTSGGEQALFDQAFQQISSGTPSQSVDYSREYFDLLERQQLDHWQNIRTARRVAEVTALQTIRAQIVAQAVMATRQQVLMALRNDPTLLQAIAREVRSSQGQQR